MSRVQRSAAAGQRIRGVVQPRIHSNSRMVLVAAARWASSTAGAELAMPGMLWCSATQNRW